MFYKILKTGLTLKNAIRYFSEDKKPIRFNYGTVLDPNLCSLNDLQFSYFQIISDVWQVLDYDYDTENKVNDLKKIAEDSGLVIDPMFHGKENINIEGYWTLFSSQFFDDDIKYDIIKFLYENGKLNKQ